MILSDNNEIDHAKELQRQELTDTDHGTIQSQQKSTESDQVKI